MHDPAAEAARWMDQAENDLEFARYALEGGYHHQVCFLCHQASEKAIKSVLFGDGARTVIGHSLVGLIDKLSRDRATLAALRDGAAELDLFYIPTRYPNGLVEGTPHEAFTRSQAERAISQAERILEAARATLS
ncbi:MAG: HEPN domain-containing protein [Deltaproteobacteria bacterium]|nr:HEPN domain-containing protein [Deltaproteobacteria bacterium]